MDTTLDATLDGDATTNVTLLLQDESANLGKCISYLLCIFYGYQVSVVVCLRVITGTLFYSDTKYTLVQRLGLCVVELWHLVAVWIVGNNKVPQLHPTKYNSLD